MKTKKNKKIKYLSLILLLIMASVISIGVLSIEVVKAAEGDVEDGDTNFSDDGESDYKDDGGSEGQQVTEGNGSGFNPSNGEDNKPVESDTSGFETSTGCSDTCQPTHENTIVQENVNAQHETRPTSSWTNTSLAQQANNMHYNAFQLSVRDDKGNVLFYFDVTSSDAYKPSANAQVWPGLTTDTRVSAAYIESMLTANNGAMAKDLILSHPGATNITVEQIHSYKIGNKFVYAKDKDVVASGGYVNGVKVSNMSALIKNMNELWVTDGLGHVLGVNPAACAAMGSAAGGSGVGCGMNIYDLLALCGMTKIKPGLKPTLPGSTGPACPNGQMNLKNGSSDCYETLGGITTSYSYTAGGGSRADVHQTHGQQTAKAGQFCAMFCNEYGTATLPGAIKSAVQLGSYIIWPTSDKNVTYHFARDNYPLKFRGTKSCRLVLMPDHGNYPGTGCVTDPIYDYLCAYQGVAVSTAKNGGSCNSPASSLLWIGRKEKDFLGTDYETVRQRIDPINSEPSNCGEEKIHKADLECPKGSWSQFRVNSYAQNVKYYNSGERYQRYGVEIVTNGINVAAVESQQACFEVMGYCGGDGCSCIPPTIRKCTGYSQGGSSSVGVSNNPNAPGNEECYEYPNPELLACEAAWRRFNAARARYDSYMNRAKAVEANMGVCRNYIQKFNYARKILVQIGVCGNFSVGDARNYFKFTSKASYSYQNGNCSDPDASTHYCLSGALQQENDLNVSCSGGCGGLGFEDQIPQYPTLETLDPQGKIEGKRNSIESRIITLQTNTVIYKSTSNYSYVDKQNNKYATNRPSSNYLPIKTLNGDLAKVLPTAYGAKYLDSSNSFIQDNFKLKITDAKFGEGNKFSVNNGKDFVCNYEVTKKNSDCICPQDSGMPGKQLMWYVVNDPISCANAMEKYCKAGSGDGPSGDIPMYCGDGTSMVACLKTGKGLSYCQSEVCGSGKLKCKNTNGLRTGMDITDCYQTKRAQGYSSSEALDYCDAVVCPIGKFIIYRTIKLENPFPGKDISKIAKGFNNDVIGRYPGSNWNGELLVYNKIRNNRSSKTYDVATAINTTSTLGTTIYQKRTPLYTFVLDGVTIGRIRTYNKNQKEGYNDYNLNCKTGTSGGCRSSFVHNSAYGLTGGTCQNIGVAVGFYECVNSQ